jgi:sentrin-specific protease 1
MAGRLVDDDAILATNPTSAVDEASITEATDQTTVDLLRGTLNYDIADYLCQVQLESERDILEEILRCLEPEDCNICDAPPRLQNRFRAVVLWQNFLTQAKPSATVSDLQCLEKEFLKPDADNWVHDHNGRSQPKNGNQLQPYKEKFKKVVALMMDHEEIKKLLFFLESPGSSQFFPRKVMDENAGLLERMKIQLPVDSPSSDSKAVAIRALRTAIERKTNYDQVSTVTTAATLPFHYYKTLLLELQGLLRSWTASVLTTPDRQARGYSSDRPRADSTKWPSDLAGNHEKGHGSQQVSDDNSLEKDFAHDTRPAMDSTKRRSDVAGSRKEDDDASADTLPARGGAKRGGRLFRAVVTVPTPDPCGEHQASGNANLGNPNYTKEQRSLQSSKPVEKYSSSSTKSEPNSKPRWPGQKNKESLWDKLERPREATLQREKRQILRVTAGQSPLDPSRARKTWRQEDILVDDEILADDANDEVIHYFNEMSWKRDEEMCQQDLDDEIHADDAGEADTKQALLIEGSSRILGSSGLLTGQDQQIVDKAMHGMGPYNEVIVKSNDEVIHYFNEMSAKREEEMCQQDLDDEILADDAGEADTKHPLLIEGSSRILGLLTGEEQQIVKEAMYGMGPSNEVIVKSGADSVQRGSIQTLLPGQWLNDEVIHYFYEMLAKRDEEMCQHDPSRKRCHFFKSFFITTLLNQGHSNPDLDGKYDYQNVKGWSERVVPGKDLFNLDKFVFPINEGRMHWVCAVAFMQEKRIQMYDSMGSDGMHFLESLLQYIKDEHQAKKGTPLPGAHEWRLVPCASSTPHQRNGRCCALDRKKCGGIWDVSNSCALFTIHLFTGYDCGVFTCLFAYHCSIDTTLDFSQNDIPLYRQRVALSLLTGKLF